MKIRLFLLIFILLFLQGCGQVYVAPQVRCNSIGLKKVPLDESGIKSYTSVFTFYPAQSYEDAKKNWDKTFEIFGQWGWSYEVNFCGQDYYLLPKYTWWGHKSLLVIRKQDKQIVHELDFGFIDFAAFEIKMNDVPYLVIYEDLLRSSNLSELLIVDSNFNVVYLEWLTSAFDFGYVADNTYGNCIVVKSRNRWKAVEIDDWQKINGDWVYYLPLNKSQERNPVPAGKRD